MSGNYNIVAITDIIIIIFYKGCPKKMSDSDYYKLNQQNIFANLKGDPWKLIKTICLLLGLESNL